MTGNATKKVPLLSSSNGTGKRRFRTDSPFCGRFVCFPMWKPVALGCATSDPNALNEEHARSPNKDTVQKPTRSLVEIAY